jgi:hypothetical protein
MKSQRHGNVTRVYPRHDFGLPALAIKPARVHTSDLRSTGGSAMTDPMAEYRAREISGANDATRRQWKRRCTVRALVWLIVVVALLFAASEIAGAPSYFIEAAGFICFGIITIQWLMAISREPCPPPRP